MRKLLKNTISVVMLSIFWFLAWWLFKVRNKLTIVGKENLPSRTGILLYANHQSLIDSMLVAFALFSFSDILFHFRRIPWNAAAWENFFKQTSRRIFCYFLKIIPAYRNSDMVSANNAVKEYAHILEYSNLLLFFEGTRSRDGIIGKCRYGPAKLITDHHPVAIPIKIEGMEKVMPIDIGFKWLKIKGGNHIVIKIGKEVDFNELGLEDIRFRVRDSVVNL